MAEERKCPHCGERVYATDDVCMSCGESLVAAQPPAPEQPPAAPQAPAQPPTPAPAPRPPSSAGLPVTERIVGSVGGFWNIFPWLALALMVGLPLAATFGTVAVATAVGPESTLPALLYIGAISLSVLVGAALTFWVVVDVLHQQAGIWWIFIILLVCGPIGLLMYLLMARE